MMLRATLLAGWTALACSLASSALAQSADLTLTLQAGDTLYDLADHHLDDPGMWPAVASANGIADPLRLQPGGLLRIPAELLRKRPGGATVLFVSGAVALRTAEGEDATPAPGQVLRDGDSLTTEDDGFISLQLADGAVLRVSPDTVLRLDEVRYRVRQRRGSTQVSLNGGRVDATVPPQRRNGGRFEVRTPLMAAGVRGTAFGVSHDVELGNATTDVLHGRVQVVAAHDQALLPAGEGASVTGNGTLQETRLLPAPELPDLLAPLHLETQVLTLPDVPGAAAYLAVVSLDPELRHVVGQVRTRQPRLRFGRLPEGQAFLTVRAIDAHGVAGLPVQRALTVDYLPPPPIPLAPAPDAQVHTDPVVLSWARPAQGERFLGELRAADTPDTLLQTVETQGSEWSLPGLPAGTYLWQLRTQGDARDPARLGPFGPALAFTVRPLAAAGTVADPTDPGALVASWTEEPGGKYLAQIASDDSFTQPVAELRTQEPRWRLPDLPGGTYHLRVQTQDADGNVLPFGPSHHFTIAPHIQLGSGGRLNSLSGPVGTP